jgi:hypothetical protein
VAKQVKRRYMADNSRIFSSMTVADATLIFLKGDIR